MAIIALLSVILNCIIVVHSTSITINNAGFESDNPNCPPRTYWYANKEVIGWTAYDPYNVMTGESDIGYANTQNGDIMNDPIYGSSPPEGNAIVYTFVQKQGNGESGIEQTLSATLEPNTKYTLTAKVGNPGDGCWGGGTDGAVCYDKRLGFTGYIIQLLAGNTVLAQDDNSIYVDDYLWKTTRVQFTTTSSHSQLDNALKIRLLQKNDQDSSGWLLFFDDVTLDASLVTTTANPSRTPTANPSLYPSSAPSSNPSILPTVFPSTAPTKQPHDSPTIAPINTPTDEPTSAPTKQPHATPSMALTTLKPTQIPSKYPTLIPTDAVVVDSTLIKQSATEEKKPVDLLLIVLISVVSLLAIIVMATLFCLCRYILYDLYQQRNAEKDNMEHKMMQLNKGKKKLHVMHADNEEGMKPTIEGNQGMRATVEGPADIMNRIGGKKMQSHDDEFVVRGNDEIEIMNRTEGKHTTKTKHSTNIEPDEFVIEADDETNDTIM